MMWSANDGRVDNGLTSRNAGWYRMDAPDDRMEDSVVAPDARLLSRVARPESARPVDSPFDGVSTRDVDNRFPVGLAILLGITAAEILRQGAFYPRDAFVVAVLSCGAIAFELLAGIDRRGSRVAQAVGLCSVWWLYAAIAHGRGKAFLPLGASMLGFLAGFLLVRKLDEAGRTQAATAVATIGAGAAAIGLYASVIRRFPLAMPAQNLWRLSTTLTYADAAGLLVGMALLVGVGLDQRKWLSRVDVYLCTAALVATQSRGAVLAVAVGAFLLPMTTARAALRPVLAGVAGGLVVVATSSGPRTHPIAGAALVVVLVIAIVVRPPSTLRRVTISRHAVIVTTLVTLGCALVALVALRTPIQRRVELSSTNDRVVEWKAAVAQWRSSPLTGTGPDKILRFHSPHGTFAHFAHNEYLQVAAGSGAVGLALLVLAIGAVAVAVRRDDASSSCACAALVAFAFAGLLDFDWHLSALGLLAGCVAGLAGRPPPITGTLEPAAAAAAPPTAECAPAEAEAEAEPVVVVEVEAEAEPEVVADAEARAPAGNDEARPAPVDTPVSHWHLYVALPVGEDAATRGRTT
jgi:hypothetical protein